MPEITRITPFFAKLNFGLTLNVFQRLVKRIQLEEKVTLFRNWSFHYHVKSNFFLQLYIDTLKSVWREKGMNYKTIWTYFMNLSSGFCWTASLFWLLSCEIKRSTFGSTRWQILQNWVYGSSIFWSKKASFLTKSQTDV